MTKLSTFLIGAALSAGAFGQAAAASLDAMQGAWTMDGTECAQTFKTVNGKSQFIDEDASVSTGIIIDGKKLIGQNGTCTIEGVSEKADMLVAHLGCADAVAFSDVTVNFKIIDATHIERFDPDFGDIGATYSKCDP